MDKLSQFLVETFQPSAPITARPQMQFVEPTFLEKRAYSMASMSLGQDTDFLEKFEGTPLAPQAIALAEQELAMQQQQLQKRMQRTAERKMDDTWDQDCIQEDGLRLQKQQLLLQLYKMKAMTPAPQLGSEIGPGTEGNAPVAEQEPKLAAFVRSFMKRASPLLDPRQLALLRHYGGHTLAGAGVGAGVGALSAGEGHRGEGALAGGLAGGAAGAGTAAARSLLAENRNQMLHAIPHPDHIWSDASAAEKAVHRAQGEVRAQALHEALKAHRTEQGLALGAGAAGTVLGGGAAGGVLGQQKREAAQPKLAAAPGSYDTKALLKKYPGMEVGEDEPHTQLLELGGHPGLPIEARQAILQKYLEHRSGAPLMTPEAAMQQERGRRGGIGGAIGAFGGGALGTFGGALLGAHHGGEPGASLGALAGMLAGGVGGGMLGHGIGSATASQHTADSNIEGAKAHQAALAPLLADPVARERILHELTARHYQNQIRALNARGEAGDFDDVDFDDVGAKKASIKKFAAALRRS